MLGPFPNGTTLQFDDVTITYTWFPNADMACQYVGGTWDNQSSTCPGYTCSQGVDDGYTCVADS